MANHLMIDVETLGTRPTSVVFQVGIIAFTDDGTILEEILFHLDILPQMLSGKTIDSSALEFWKQQDESAWVRNPSQVSSVRFVFSEIARMMGNHGVGWVWSNSPSFDAVIMRNLCETSGPGIFQFPSFRSDMDMRTLKQLLSSLELMNNAPKSETTHNALQDCRDQVATVVFMLKKLNEMKASMEAGPIVTS